MARTMFIQGPAGVGKTTAAVEHIRDLLDAGASPEHILILVPQRTLGRPYQDAFATPDWPGGAAIDVLTLGGLARRGLETFWPLVAEKAGFTHPDWEPVFLTIETAQYYMARFVDPAVETGVFDSVGITNFRIMNQILDNLSKAAVNSFPIDETARRLTAAWGDRHSSRPPVYQASMQLALQFRDFCRENSLLDFSYQIELFMDYLLPEPLYRDYVTGRYRHLVADNLEESFPVVADFIRWLWPDLETARLLYDQDAGYRIFLGADPSGMHDLADLCEEVVTQPTPVSLSPSLDALALTFDHLLDSSEPPELVEANPRAGFTYEFHKFFPQMIDWTIERIAELIDNGVPPREIVVLAPYLDDSLRFSLMERLRERGIDAVSHRPSRAVRDEPSARAVLALMAVAHPEWGVMPPVMDIANALDSAIDDLDPVRAWLLARIVYKPSRADELGSFDAIESRAQERITFRAGNKYEHLRDWIANYQTEESPLPPDHFISRLFGEVLSQPGYGFHTNLDAGRVVAQLVESAQKFRQTLYPSGVDNWSPVAQEYFALVQEGVLAASYMAGWQAEEQDAVFLAPAYTFLMRNRWVDYQFWLDVGSSLWWERLEQPLTHPYVLARSYPPSQIWTDDLEYFARRDALRRLVVGLVRRCRTHIYAAIADLGEHGYEQRGPLLTVFQQVVQRYSDSDLQESNAEEETTP